MDQICIEDKLSLRNNFPSEEDEEDIDQNLIEIQFDSHTIHVNFSQLCKYSQLIRDEYPISDIQGYLCKELKKLQRENNIDTENIISFFSLLHGEEILLSSAKYRDLLKLSEFFKVKKLILQLNKYFKKHFADINFIIQILLKEISIQNDKEKIDHLFTTQINQLLTENINECLQNNFFKKLPIQQIFKIIEKSDKEKLSIDLLFDFIKESLENNYILLKFIDFKKLSNDKFNELCDLLFDSNDKNENNRYIQYLTCDLKYIKQLKSSNEELQKKLNQTEQEKIELLNRIKELEQKVDFLEDRLNQTVEQNSILLQKSVQDEQEKSLLLKRLNEMDHTPQPSSVSKAKKKKLEIDEIVVNNLEFADKENPEEGQIKIKYEPMTILDLRKKVASKLGFVKETDIDSISLFIFFSSFDVAEFALLDDAENVEDVLTKNPGNNIHYKVLKSVVAIRGNTIKKCRDYAQKSGINLDDEKIHKIYKRVEGNINILLSSIDYIANKV